MVKLGVFSDTHVGRNLPREIGELRRVAFRSAFSRAIDLFVEEKVDYAIHCGDVFERRGMTPDDTIFVKNEFQRLIDELGGDVKIFILRGNHDGSADTNFLNYIEHPLARYLKIVGERLLEGEEEVYREEEFALAGIGYTPYISGRMRAVKSAIRRSLGKAGAEHRIFLLHAFVEGHHELPPGVPGHQKVSLSDLADLNVTMIFCGHHHERKGDNLGNFSIITPGSTDCVFLSDRGPHGCYVVELGPPPSIRFREIDPLYAVESVTIGGAAVSESREWFLGEAKRAMHSFAERLRLEGKEGILRLVLEGLVEFEKYELDAELREVEESVRRESKQILHIELENRIRRRVEEIPLRAAVEKEEILRQVFSAFGEDVLPKIMDLIEGVDAKLEEIASQRTGLLKGADRQAFIERWLRILEVEE